MIAKDLSSSDKNVEALGAGVIVFGCTSGGALGGLEHDRRVGLQIEKKNKEEVYYGPLCSDRPVEWYRPKRSGFLRPASTR